MPCTRPLIRADRKRVGYWLSPYFSRLSSCVQTNLVQPWRGTPTTRLRVALGVPDLAPNGDHDRARAEKDWT